MNAASAPISASKPCPSSASAAICRSSATACRSSSARRFTTAPIMLRSSCAGSAPRTKRHGSRVTAAAATRCFSAASSSLLDPSDAIARIPVALLFARYSTISRRAASSGATERNVLSGISARSPASIPSNAGSLVRRSRTQVTVRAIASARASTNGSAVGRSVWMSSRSDAIRRILYGRRRLAR